MLMQYIENNFKVVLNKYGKIVEYDDEKVSGPFIKLTYVPKIW
jgi:hypothetical protein